VPYASKEPELMLAILATDPGAWNIIGWMLVLAAVGAVILWVVTTLLLRSGSTDRSEGREPHPS
jgi:hypothetical protein